MPKVYKLTEAQHQKIVDACNPVVIGGVEPRSPQDNADDAWKSLAKEMGFVWDTAEPVPGKDTMYFSAEPSQENFDR